MSASPLDVTCISCENLGLRINGRALLHDITLQIPKKGITCLLGPQDAGKTLLLWVICRMADTIPHAQTSGRVYIDGRDILDPGADLLLLHRDVGLVQPRPAVFSMSVYRNVVYGLRQQGITAKAEMDEMARHALEDVGLWELLRDKARLNAGRLSPLEQQKLCIARSLCAGAKILLMDEPWLEFDHPGRMEMEQLLVDLQSKYTIVAATRDPYAASRISSYCVLLQGGRVTEAAPTLQLFTRPKNPDTASFITGHRQPQGADALSG